MSASPTDRLLAAHGIPTAARYATMTDTHVRVALRCAMARLGRSTPDTAEAEASFVTADGLMQLRELLSGPQRTTRCPGCGVGILCAADPSAAVAALYHADDDCQLLRAVTDAVALVMDPPELVH